MRGRILFLVEGSEERGHSPAARFRVHQLVPYYEEAGWRCVAAWSFPKKYFAASPFFRKIRNRPVLFYPLSAVAVAVMAVHRLIQILTRAPFADIVFLQRNLLPTRGFPFLELLASKLAGKTIFDFDDAVFTHNRDPGRRYKDIPRILGFTDTVVCGNGYLAEYARGYNSNVTVIPTVPPLSNPRRRARTERPVVIGWIGTAPNIPYLRKIEGALLRLAERLPVTFLTVSDEPLRMPAGIPHEHRTWSIEEERRFFDTIDIGIMPLSDDEWTRGKCAFKAIGYLSHGIPAVVSPVGANREIAAEGEGVLFASTEPEWEEKLFHLCQDSSYRDAMVGRGRETATRFSPEAAAGAYEEVFHRMRFRIDLPSWLAGEGDRPPLSDGAVLPRISVIVPSFQQARFLERTIRSILNQNYPATEILVIDGGSTDGSVEILRKFDRHLAYWCSEADAGQADALNKGLAKATGEIVGWQNSDDIYLPGAFAAAAAAFRKDPSLDLLHGNILVIDDRDRPLDEWRYVPLHRKALSYQWNLLSNQSVFWRRISPRIGRFDPAFQFCMDYDFFERAVSAGARARFLPAFLGAVRMHTESKTSRMRERGSEEEARIRARHGAPGPIREAAMRVYLRGRRIAWFLANGETMYLLRRRLRRG